MKIAYHWLQKWVKTPQSAQQIADELSVKGLEVEHIENWRRYTADFDNLVVAEVLKVWKHPNADKLNLTLVNNGSQTLQVVCGAPNVAPGQKVILAQVGCTITMANGDSFEIKKSKIRGEESNGMLCAEDEIGLGKSHDGIMVLNAEAVVGTPLSAMYQNAYDQVMEIGLTANRGDAASHLGTARDVAAIFNLDIEPLPAPFACTTPSSVAVSIAQPALCSVYNLVELSVHNQASPMWLQNNLKSIGIEPKNIVVDVTNYVLHDIGQPLHAFDADKILGNITVQLATNGQKFTTLDKQELTLTDTDLIIADQNGPLALAGVMGGLPSAVSNATTRIVLECAHFYAPTVRKSAKKHALSTDSSYRFERGVDPQLSGSALALAVDLLTQYAQATVIGASQAIGQTISNTSITMDTDYVSQVAGCPIPLQNQEQILTKLGFKVYIKDKTMQVQVPSWRMDCTTAVDLAEEVLRIYGFDNIAMPTHLKMSMPVYTGLPKKHKIQKMLDYLKAQGFYETKTNSLVNAAEYPTTPAPVALSNPLSAEMGVMRNHMLPSVLHTMVYNQNRNNEFNHYFELGKVYLTQPDGKIIEKQQLIIAAMGNTTHTSWQSKPQEVDYYYIKNHAQNCLYAFGAAGFTNAVTIGESSAAQQQKWGLKQPVYYAIIDVFELQNKSTTAVQIANVPKFPAMVRDLSLVVEAQVPYSYWQQAWNQISALLQTVNVFDIYQGQPLQANQKSIAISFEFMHPDRTLQSEEIDELMKQIIVKLEKAGAIIRK